MQNFTNQLRSSRLLRKILKGKVIDEIEKGYFLNEKVIRYAKVIVGA